MSAWMSRRYPSVRAAPRYAPYDPYPRAEFPVVESVEWEDDVMPGYDDFLCGNQGDRREERQARKRQESKCRGKEQKKKKTTKSHTSDTEDIQLAEVEDTEDDVTREAVTRRLVTEFADTTGIHGFQAAVHAGSGLVKLVWILLVAAATAAMAVHTHTLLLEYMEERQVVSITSMDEKLAFPSVTICNINPLRNSQIDNSSELAEYLRNVSAAETYSELAEEYQRWGSVERPRQQVEYTCTGSDAHHCSVQPLCDPDDDLCQQNFTILYQWRNQTFNSSEIPANVTLVDGFQDLRGRIGQAGDGVEIDKAWLRASNWIGDAERFGGGAPVPHAEVDHEIHRRLAEYDPETLASMGHQPETLVLDCHFNNRQCYFWNFTRRYHSQYGNCYTINSAEHQNRTSSLRSQRAGPDYGLSMWLYIEEDEYRPILTHGKGVKVAVHQYGAEPQIVENSASLSPGSETFLSMTLTSSTRWADSGCDDTRGYTVDACLSQCASNLTMSVCGCRRVDRMEDWRSSWYRKPLCTEPEDLLCSSQVGQLVLEDVLRCPCRQACHSNQYHTQTSHLPWPSHTLWYDLVNMVCERSFEACARFVNITDPMDRIQKLRDNFVKVHVYYSDLSYTNTVEHPEYTFEKFLADIGGTLGFWIGATAFTTLETLIFLTQCCWIQCCKTFN